MCRAALLILVVSPAALSSLAAPTAPRTLESPPPVPTFNVVAAAPEDTIAGGASTQSDSEEIIRSATTTCFRVRRSLRNALITPHPPSMLMIRCSGIRQTIAPRAFAATRRNESSLSANSSPRSDCGRLTLNVEQPGGGWVKSSEPGHFATARGRVRTPSGFEIRHHGRQPARENRQTDG